jgi:hypothetical protein
MHLRLPTTSFSRLSDHFDLPKDAAYLIRYAAVRDGLIDAIGRSILSERMTETSAGRMYAETASLMLAAHIFSGCRDSGSHQAAPMLHRLDDRRLHRVLDYVEDSSFSRYSRRRSRQCCVSQHFSFHPFVYVHNGHASASLRQPKTLGPGKGNNRSGKRVYRGGGFRMQVFLASEL